MLYVDLLYLCHLILYFLKLKSYVACNPANTLVCNSFSEIFAEITLHLPYELLVYIYANKMFTNFQYLKVIQGKKTLGT